MSDMLDNDHDDDMRDNDMDLLVHGASQAQKLNFVQLARQQSQATRCDSRRLSLIACRVAQLEVQIRRYAFWKEKDVHWQG